MSNLHLVSTFHHWFHFSMLSMQITVAIRRAIVRFIHCSMARSFINWYNDACTFKHQTTQVKTALLMWSQKYSRHGFCCWRYTAKIRYVSLSACFSLILSQPLSLSQPVSLSYSLSLDSLSQLLPLPQVRPAKGNVSSTSQNDTLQAHHCSCSMESCSRGDCPQKGLACVHSTAAVLLQQILLLMEDVCTSHCETEAITQPSDQTMDTQQPECMLF